MQESATHAFEDANVYFRHLPYDHPHHPRHSDKHKHRYQDGSSEPQGPSAAGPQHRRILSSDGTDALSPGSPEDAQHLCYDEARMKAQKALLAAEAAAQTFGQNTSNVARQPLWLKSFVKSAVSTVSSAASRTAALASTVVTKTAQVVTSTANAVGSAAVTVVKVAATAGSILTGQAVEWNYKKAWDLFGFNWDSQAQKIANERLVVYEDEYIAFTCESCFMRLQAGVEFALQIRGRASFPFLSTEYLLAAVDGTFQSEVLLKLHAERTWSHQWEKQLIKDVMFGEVVISVGPVPIPISAFGGLKVSLELNLCVPLTALPS